jgi:hypothetical protein
LKNEIIFSIFSLLLKYVFSLVLEPAESSIAPKRKSKSKKTHGGSLPDRGAAAQLEVCLL